MGYYSREVLATLILMIATGAGRTLAVKVYFQLGFDDPFLVSILMLLGYSFAVPIYWLVEWLAPATDATDAGAEDADGDRTDELKDSNSSRVLDLEKAGETRAIIVPDTDVDVNKAEGKEKYDGTLIATDEEKPQVIERPKEESSQTRDASSVDEDPPAENASSVDDDPPAEKETAEISRKITNARQRKSNRGSAHGLTEESREAIQWVHKIPNWAKPLISSGFNLLDVAFRMLSILYLAASVAEMLVGGTELILSMVAARVVRKRLIARQRWCGAGIMMVGLVLVACSDLISNNESSQKFGLGVLFVILKVIMGVSKDMVEELFMQEGDFSATLLLGMEGVYGLLMAVPLYFLLGPVAGYEPVDAFRGIGESSLSIGYTFGLLLIFFVTGMYSILGTAVTSTMTKNMWKNFRGLVVWTAAMIIFYASGDEDVGEPFSIPGSFMILAGFSFMLSALYVYYTE